MVEQMYTVYVLKSQRNAKRYVGYTSKTVEARVQEHNSGTNSWTRANKPFIVVYTERFDSKKEAIQREHFLKSGQGRKFLDSTIPG